MKGLIFIIYFFQIIVNINCQQYVPMGRILHTATLVGTKIYFLGGKTSDGKFTNDFFYLDISKSFDKTKGMLPFVNLSDKSLEIPPHYGATTAVFGELKDSIFFFGGNMSSLNSPQTSMYSFNTTQLEWKTIVVSQGIVPGRRILTDAVTDNNNKIYIFGGATLDINVTYNNDMIIFDTINNIWINGVNGLFIRVGQTATFLPDTSDIIYIGGYSNGLLMDMTNLDVYNTINNRWDIWITKNPPEQRGYHTDVLTNDNRIIIFGGTGTDMGLPVKNYYAVLDITTLEWYLGKGYISDKAPYRGHTATFYNDYMFVAFGQPSSSYSRNVFIYKIEDYANFTEVYYFINENLNPTTQASPTSSVDNNNDSSSIIIGATLGSILGIMILGFTVGFIIFNRTRRTNRH